jgi:coronin-1B/1C/6
MRAYKTVNDSYIEPISFTVPRRAETFQSDIFPPAFGSKPAVSAKEWLEGKTGLPPKIDLESIYEGSAPVEIPSDYKAPPAASASTPASKPAPKKEPEPKPTPAVARAPPPSTADQKASISAMANKYQDNEESSSDDDDAETSSFEEITKPVQRTTAPAPTKSTSEEPTKPVQLPQRSSPPAATQANLSSPVKSPTVQKSPEPVSQPTAAGGSSLESSLEHIKHLLEQQTRIISAQSDRIGQLTAEVETLKKRVGNGPAAPQDQSERIRQLELELEAARS